MGHLYIKNNQKQEAISTWVNSYMIAKQIGHAQTLQALSELAPQLDLPNGLSGWELLARETRDREEGETPCVKKKYLFKSLNGFSLGKGNKKKSSCVGPIIFSLYEQIDTDRKAAFKKFLSGAPSGCEIVVNLGQMSGEVAEIQKKMTLQWLKELSLKKQAIVGLEQLSDETYVLYIKGSFENSQLEQLRGFFLQYQADVNSHFPASMHKQLDIHSGCFSDEQLTELT
jgi:hypothetical protein